MKITEGMVDEFNETLDNMSCSFRIKYVDKDYPICEIVPANMLFIDSFIINPTEEFYDALENFFNKKGIELTYNNTGTIFWSKTGWTR